MWIARDGESVIVTTVEGAGKVKRLRNDARVQLAPCTIGGKVAPHAVWVEATATVEPITPEMERILAAKYKLAYRLTWWLDRRRRSDPSPRVILRIS